MQQLKLLDVPEDPKAHLWQPEPLPDLSAADEIVVDFETTGLRWWRGDVPIAASVGWWEGRNRTGKRHTRYVPWRHRGGNVDEGAAKAWFTSLTDKIVYTLNGRFEVHVANNWGISFEQQRCKVRDVAHLAALLDDHRMFFSLNALAQDELGDVKLDTVDPARMVEYHAGSVAAYGLRDNELTGRLAERYEPRIATEGLEAVANLESELIYVTCEMERNAAPIDVPLLKRWVLELEQEYHRILWELYRDTGLRVDPNKAGDVARVFEKLGLPILVWTAGGKNSKPQPSFADEVLEQYEHPTAVKIRKAKKLFSLNTKFMLKYARIVGDDALLRYALHQLRQDEGGTISGRFSSSALERKQKGEDEVGTNIQQVPAVEKQVFAQGLDPDDPEQVKKAKYLVRQLFKAPPGRRWNKADAAQIEYRLLAHYLNDRKILDAYKQDPWTNFHKLVFKFLRDFDPHIMYKVVKNTNFCKAFGGGPEKIAATAGVSLEVAYQTLSVYDRIMPGLDQLLRRCSDTAERRGYVRSILGRRSRFREDCKCRSCVAFGPRYYKALNAVIQPSAADIMKTKLVELHRERKSTGLVLRFTVHDETDGDVPDEESARKVSEILNRQSFDLRVPILWEVSTGDNWAECA